MGPHIIEPITRARLALLAANPALLERLGRGIEKESLRVSPEGRLSPAAHPTALGSPLTHPSITTDFSEAQLELITRVHRSPAACVAELVDIHRFVYANLGDEALWPASMPCILGDEADIPIGRYGTSNIGRAKSVYRQGLANRYGALMQTISGIHYNFSMPTGFWPLLASRENRVADKDFRTAAYFGLIRNFRRYSWLLIYLFGASPAVCKSFVRQQPAHGLQNFDEGSLYLPHATSLRMGRLGYQSDAQAQLHISYNSLAHYDRTMLEGLTKAYPAYEAIGVQRNGSYQQLSTALLQIENEFYGTIRPKQPTGRGERPLAALRRAGVAYVEVRCLDLNPMLPAGIDAETVRFLDLFLLYCLLAPSPPDSPEETERMRENQLRIVERGRAPALSLATAAGDVPMQQLATELLDACAPLAPLLDEANRSQGYTASLQAQRRKVSAPDETPAGQVLATMRRDGIPFFRFAMNQAQHHSAFYATRPLTAAEQAVRRAEAEQSLSDQAAIEAADQLPFDEFLEAYLAPP